MGLFSDSQKKTIKELADRDVANARRECPELHIGEWAGVTTTIDDGGEGVSFQVIALEDKK